MIKGPQSWRQKPLRRARHPIQPRAARRRPEASALWHFPRAAGLGIRPLPPAKKQGRGLQDPGPELPNCLDGPVAWSAGFDHPAKFTALASSPETVVNRLNRHSPMPRKAAMAATETSAVIRPY
jgi:hypothetical protein